MGATSQVHVVVERKCTWPLGSRNLWIGIKVVWQPLDRKCLKIPLEAQTPKDAFEGLLVRLFQLSKVPNE